MKLIVLAAGEGSRLRPLTNNRPKCMVEFQGKAMIDYIVENALQSGLAEMDVILGYKNEILSEYLRKYTNIKFKFYMNEKYQETNMVHTLFCAEEEMQEDMVISYSDIVYKRSILKQIMDTKESAIIIDKDWKSLWEKRMEDPLSDAETLKIDEQGYITEIGKKPISYEDIEGQYIGLVKFGEKDIQRIKEIYYQLDRTQLYDDKPFEKMFMTSFLQILIDRGIKFKAITINGGWVEIDSVQDLERLKDYRIE